MPNRLTRHVCTSDDTTAWHQATLCRTCNTHKQVWDPSSKAIPAPALNIITPNQRSRRTRAQNRLNRRVDRRDETAAVAPPLLDRTSIRNNVHKQVWDPSSKAIPASAFNIITPNQRSCRTQVQHRLSRHVDTRDETAAGAWRILHHSRSRLFGNVQLSYLVKRA